MGVQQANLCYSSCSERLLSKGAANLNLKWLTINFAAVTDLDH